MRWRDETQDWLNEAHRYVTEALGPTQEAQFWSDAGLPPTSLEGRLKQILNDYQLFMYLSVDQRCQRLLQFIAELRAS